MFKKNTVLILGAGSSCHLGYPTGKQLIGRIIGAITGGFLMNEDEQELLSSCQNHKEFKQALDRHDVIESSIDVFLRSHPEYADIGKHFIANEILKAEHPEETKMPIFEYKSGNWYGILRAKIISSLNINQPQDLLNNKLSIITFNYDISLDYYLYTRLRETRSIADVVDGYLNQLEIIRVYGAIRQAPYDAYGAYRSIKTGADNTKSFDCASKLKNNIRVIGEQKQNDLKNSPHIIKAKQLISNAREIYFLGFGFDDNNISLLDLDKGSLFANTETIYYTNYGGLKKIDRKVQKLFGRLREKEIFGMREDIEIIPSHRTVYGALTNDF